MYISPDLFSDSFTRVSKVKFLLGSTNSLNSYNIIREEMRVVPVGSVGMEMTIANFKSQARACGIITY